MSIKRTGQITHSTAPNNSISGGATEFSLYFKLRVEPETNPASTTLTWLFGGGGYTAAYATLNGAGSDPDTVKCRFTFRNSANDAIYNDVNLALGTVYSLAMVWSQGGGHRAYVNGQRRNLTALSGTLPTGNISYGSGLWAYNPQGVVFSIEDIATWKGHALTDTQAADLRDGAIRPQDITSGTWRGLWDQRGDVGTVPVLGVGGLANKVGDQLWPLKTSTGTGTAVYGGELVWEPSVEIGKAYVATGGRMAFFFPRTIAGQKDTLCINSNFPPTFKVNGQDVGAGTLVQADGGTVPASFLMPRDVQRGDVVTYSAEANWLNTVGGAAAGAVDAPMGNFVGQSCFRKEGEPKTLRMGVNVEGATTSHSAAGPYLKDWSRRIGAVLNVVEWDANYKPTKFKAGTTSSTGTLYSGGSENGLDETGCTGPTGKFAIQYDYKDKAKPTSLRIGGGLSGNTVVTPLPEYDNPGTLIDGWYRGRCKVYDGQRKAGSTTMATNYSVAFEAGDGLLEFENLCIHHEVDFTPGTPTVLDNSDPYALSKAFLDLFPGPGSMRYWGVLLGGVNAPFIEKEQARHIEDFSWGWAKNRAGWTIRWTQATPFSTADTPWFYNFSFGEKYGANLSLPVDEHATSFRLSITAGQGNEVLIGSRLFLGAEVCRVDEVDGATYTVTRGIEGTTPASHAAGPIQVGYRCPMVEPGGNSGTNYWFNGSYFRLKSQDPHRLWTGYVLILTGDWPVFQYTHGYSGKPSGAWGAMVVTGPDTVVIKAAPWNEPPHTLLAPVTLDPTKHANFIGIPTGPQTAYRMHMKAANQCNSGSAFISIPCPASRDLIRWIAEECLELEPGRLLYIEPGCEIWNFPQMQAYCFTTATSLHPGESFWSTYLEILDLYREIFEEVWGKDGRAADLRFYVNQQATLVRREVFDWAEEQDPPIKIDALALAPYFSRSTQYVSSYLQAAWANLDIPEILDLYVHHFWYTTGSGVKKQARDWKTVTDSYTEATGHPVELVSYEGWFESVLATSVPYHVEKERDFHYHPNLHIIGQDLFRLLQEVGYEHFNYFCAFAHWAFNGTMWGMYTHHYQPPGIGDGSDGQANNLLCLAVPGLPNSKRLDQNQDDANCSPLGQAWIDWNEPARSPVVPRPEKRGVRMAVMGGRMVNFRGY